MQFFCKYSNLIKTAHNFHKNNKLGFNPQLYFKLKLDCFYETCVLFFYFKLLNKLFKSLSSWLCGM